MANVKRYDLHDEEGYSSTQGVMMEFVHGDWVSADDYDTLHEECERLRSFVDSVKEALSYFAAD